LRRDENGNVLGPLPQAFRLRPGESYLSTTWCEYFKGTDQETIRCSVTELKNSNLVVKSKSRFCVGVVKDISDCLASFGKTARFIHEPKPSNPAYVAVRNWPDDDEILDMIAGEIWTDCFSNEDVAEIIVKPCYVSERGDE